MPPGPARALGLAARTLSARVPATWGCRGHAAPCRPEPGGRRAHLAARGRSRKAGLSVVARAAALRQPRAHQGAVPRAGGLSLRGAPEAPPAPPGPALSGVLVSRAPPARPRSPSFVGPVLCADRARTQRRGLGARRAAGAQRRAPPRRPAAVRGRAGREVRGAAGHRLAPEPPPPSCRPRDAVAGGASFVHCPQARLGEA